MNYNFYCVFDKKAAVYCLPFTSQSDGTAMRDFHAAANDPSSHVHKYPADFELFRLGSYDSDSGVIVASKPIFICSAANFSEG